MRFINIVVLLGFATTLHARQQLVKNGDLESGEGPGGTDNRKALNWTFFGPTVERSEQANHTVDGGWSLKVFGSETTVGAYQDVAAAAGDDIVISAFLYTLATDKVGGDAEAKIKIEFVDVDGLPVGDPTEITVLNASSPPDTWTFASIGPVDAPAGVANARMTCVWTWTTSSLGSAYWDDCTMTINGGPNVLLNGDIETPGTSDNTPFGIDEWTGFGVQGKSSDAAYHGNCLGANSVKLQVGNEVDSQFSGLYQDIGELKAGDHVFLNCYVYSPSVGGLSDTAAAAVKLEFFPAGGTKLPPPEEHLIFDEDDPVDTWTLVSYTTTVPEEITAARIVLIADDTSAENGPVYMESAFAERSSAPGVNQLVNESFEEGSSGPNGLTNWTEFRGFTCQARKNAFEVPPLDGDSVLKISGSCVAGVYQEVEVAPGETLTLSTFCYSNSADPFSDPTSRAGVKVEWVGGTVPDQIDIGEAPNNTADSGTPTDEWTPLFIDFEMPPGSEALLRFTVILSQGTAEDVTVYFDATEAVVFNKFDGADVDADDDEDLVDFGEFQRCFHGEGVSPLDWNCIVFDSDDDEDVDLTDYGFFAPRATDPN